MANLEMNVMSAFKTSSSGLPVYKVQFLNTETGEPVSDVEIETHADCVKYINENPIIKEKLGFNPTHEAFIKETLHKFRKI